MNDLQKYKKKRMKGDPDFWKNYDERFETFKLGVLLKQARTDGETVFLQQVYIFQHDKER